MSSKPSRASHGALTTKPQSDRPPGADEFALVALLGQHAVKMLRYEVDDGTQHLCRSCGVAFEPSDQVLVHGDAATHYNCRWWWWDSPHSPIRPA
ncbi:MAG TPA: hypothetical protein VF765_31430 [Polyangiaceae bacterium]